MDDEQGLGFYDMKGISFLNLPPEKFMLISTSLFFWLNSASLYYCFWFVSFHFLLRLSLVLWHILFSRQYYQCLTLTFTPVVFISQSLVQKHNNLFQLGVMLTPYWINLTAPGT